METTQLPPQLQAAFAITFILRRGYVDLGTRKRECDVIQLSIMENSAAYVYTQSEESDRLATEDLEKERKMNDTLDDTWKKALELRRTHPRLSKVPEPLRLREEHVVALIAYTHPGKLCRPSLRLWSPLYRQFNKALRLYGADDSVYAEKFPFKAFQYLLSVAIVRLGKGQTQRTYRGMDKSSISNKGEKIKFGYFASSSLERDKTLGTETKFTISSKYGVGIENYSLFPEQKEVLIPPYETFKITSADGVDICLQTDGNAGIPVRVERGSNGEMRVLRN